MSKREAERRRRAAQDRYREAVERKRERERIAAGPKIVGNLPVVEPKGTDDAEA